LSPRTATKNAAAKNAVRKAAAVARAANDGGRSIAVCRALRKAESDFPDRSGGCMPSIPKMQYRS
jgi:hypothetical protein